MYPSAISILLNAEVPTAFGSIIHVLGDKGRERFVDVIEERKVVYATSRWMRGGGWPNWHIRSSWPYFRALYRNYQPVARNARHIFWQRRDKPLSEPENISAECSIIQRADGTAELSVFSIVDGHMEVNIALADLPDTGHGEILVAKETSPHTDSPDFKPWYDAPRYGLPNRMTHSLFLPVAAGHQSRIELEILGDRHKIEIASCEARLTPFMDISALSELPSLANYSQISSEVF